MVEWNEETMKHKAFECLLIVLAQGVKVVGPYPYLQ